ncbi:MAG TPA: ABC transporter ATP-binding protein [Gemmataceae bacterium]|nr:ABC transporter ATP-binding protein [Gemmataceae bacterium]
MTAVAQFENVGKVYATGWGRRGTRAVAGVSLQIPAGQVFGLLGPNRAGKTTLVKLLLALGRPTEGTVTRLGCPAANLATLTRVGYLHENQHFPRYLTARELLRFYGALTLMPSDTIPARADELLKLVGLADRPDEPIARFSKGMIQRLGLAQALLNDPDLLVLDEPTEGLDLVGRALLRDVIAGQRAKGKTVLLVSHVLSEVEQTCDRVAVLVNGSVVKDASVADLVRDPKTGGRRPLDQALRPLYEGANA